MDARGQEEKLGMCAGARERPPVLRLCVMYLQSMSTTLANGVSCGAPASGKWASTVWVDNGWGSRTDDRQTPPPPFFFFFSIRPPSQLISQPVKSGFNHHLGQGSQSVQRKSAEVIMSAASLSVHRLLLG